MIHASGIGAYLRGLLPELARRAGGEERIGLIGRPEELAFWSGPVFAARAPIYTLREQWEVVSAFRRSRAEILHVPHYNLPALLVSRCVVTVHDLIHLKFPQFLPSRAARAYAGFFLRTLVPRARALLTVSEHSRRDLIEILGVPREKITVAPSGPTREFRPLSPAELAPELRALQLEPGYLLYVGNVKEFKNVPFLLDVYEELRRSEPETPPLVIAGRNSIDGFEKRLLGTPGVRWLSEVEGRFLPALYGGARLFVFPSLYEGFGLPPLEAMACGTPVICSRRASLPEVVGDAALLIDPQSPSELRAALLRMLRDDALHEEMRRRGFSRVGGYSWGKTAEIVWGVYERVL